MKQYKYCIVLPQGKCSGRLCGECIWLDRSEQNKYGEFWCAKYRKYYAATESSAKYCKEFEYR